MHAKFQNKRDIRHRSLFFVCLFLLEFLPVPGTLWFLASDGSNIQAKMEDLRLIN